MNPEGWQKLDELYHSALEREPKTRATFVAEACGSDDELRRELQSMLAHYNDANSFIESPAYVLSAETIIDDESGARFIGKAVGPYQILNELGAGGMGIVYLAFDNELRRKVALKFLHSHLTDDPRRVQRFKQEARAASALNHPNILTIFEIGEIDGRQFIATELVEGETLHRLIKHRCISVGEALEIAIQAGSGLSAAHAAGIVHRDVKPENIMVRPDGYIKLVDFGVAKLVERRAPDEDGTTLVKTEEGTAVGTVRYMSPEQVRAHDVDGRTDIWSFGIVLFEMLTGSFPFAGETAGDLLVSILESEPRSLSTEMAEAPAELDRIIRRALTKDQTKRYQSVDEMLLDLRQLKSRVDAGERVRTARERKSRGAALAIGGGLVLLAALGVGWQWLKPNNIRPSESTSTALVPETPERMLSYSFTLQPMRNRKPYGAAFESLGDESVENGSKFRLNFSSPQAGFFYLLGEGGTGGAGASFTILYPDHSRGTDPLQSPPGQAIQTEWYVFDQNPGTETLWLVWAASPTPDLESVRRFLNPKDKGEISSPSEASAVRQFLVTNSLEKPRLEPDSDGKRTVAKAKGAVLVRKVDFAHR